jgi:hypothetical protein
VTGNTSTTSGLTVTLSRDQSSDCAIEAGALVLADQVRFLKMLLTIVGTVPNGLTLHIFMTFCHILACFGEFKNYFQRTDCSYSQDNIGSVGYMFFLQNKCREPSLYRML